MLSLDLNPQIQTALDLLLKTDRHVFITGRAGTGKSTLLSYFLQQLDSQEVVVLAPTGVAALNVGGETIHHFLRLKPAATTEEVIKDARRARKTKNFALYQNLETIVIDEISMVRADLFDHLDLFLRTVRGSRQAFGGVRVICFGDLYQLPPVVTYSERAIFSEFYDSPYFFSSQVFTRLWQNESLANFAYLELEKIYRQTDQEFIDLLNQIRTNSLQATALTRLNSRVLTRSALGELDSSYIILTVTRARAQAINLARLAQLTEESLDFTATSSGKFNHNSEPTASILTLKVGARVMLLNNDSEGRWINGSMGTISGLDAKAGTATVLLDTGKEVLVSRHTWEASRSVFNGDTGKIERETLGSFTQLPLCLAWAITIHKAQGQTFEHLIIDLESNAFAAGQSYVAFSRGTSLSGIYLVRPLRTSDIRLDHQIVNFFARLQAQLTGVPAQDFLSVLEDAIAKAATLAMVYPSSAKTQSRRLITPKQVGQMTFQGRQFLGLLAFCHQQQADRVFAISKILSLQPAPHERIIVEV